MPPTNQAFSARFFDALLNGLQQTRHALPRMIHPSETVASRLLNGGQLFAASVRPDFISEAYIRSGGLMLLKEYTPDTQLTAQDTVLIGWSNTSPAEERGLIRQAHQAGAYLIGIGPIPPAATADECIETLSVFLASDPPLPTNILASFGASPYPLISLQNIVILWAFTGELVAALTRQNAMPTLYQSVLVPGARARNEQRQHLRFEENHSVPPIPPGQLGNAYIDRLADNFQRLIATEINSVEQVARAGTTTLQKGHQIHAFLISHFPVLQHGAPGDPGFMQRLDQGHGETPSNTELQAKLKAGDLLFLLGYYRRPHSAYTIVHNAGARIAEIITGTNTADPPDPDYIIHPHWPFGDALVSVPGYDIEILPSSGIVQTAIYWSVLGTMVYIDHQAKLQAETH